MPCLLLMYLSQNYDVHKFRIASKYLGGILYTLASVVFFFVLFCSQIPKFEKLENQHDVIRCMQTFLSNNPIVHEIGAGPYFESRLVDAFFHEKLDMLSIQKDGGIGWICGAVKPENKIATFFVVDQDRPASVAYNKGFIEKYISSNENFKCGNIEIYSRNDSGGVLSNR